MKSWSNSRTIAPIAVALAGLLASPLPGAQEVEQSWIADAGGCRFHNAHPVADEHIRWSGGCRDGMGDGPGTLQWLVGAKPGGRYDGSFVRGMLQGQSRYVSDKGVTYDGNFVDGQMSGFGTMVWPNGDRYDGAWRAGKRTGHGSMVRPNGDHYDGEFVEGKWQGEGLFFNISGARYVGAWVANKRQGEGVARMPDGGMYRGTFVDDEPAHPEKITRNHYSMKIERTGSYIGVPVITNLELPPDQGYAELSEDDKFLARALAVTPSESDEPPYPLHGPRRILEASIKLNERFRVTGRLTMAVTVKSDGTAQDVSVFSAPDKEMTQALATVLLLEQYKPATCGGAPCTAKYYFRMNFH